MCKKKINGIKLIGILLFSFGFLLLLPFSTTIKIAGETVYPFGIKPLNSTLSSLIYILWIFISMYIYSLCFKGLFIKTYKVCVEECDPFPYIEMCEAVLGNRLIYAGRNNASRNNAMLGLCFGYLTAGNSKAAGQVIEGIRYFPSGKAGLYNKALFFYFSFIHYLQIFDMVNVEIMLKSMMAVLQDKKFPKHRYDEMYHRYIEMQISVNIANGDYTEAEEVFLVAFNNAKNRLGKVACQYQLGEIYFHYERLNDAKKAFEYVISNGNKTFYVVEAVEKIDQCVHAICRN